MLLPLLVGPLGIPELLIILFIVFLIFGAKKLPMLGAGLGEGIRNFKKSFRGDDDDHPPKNTNTDV
ncbi:MAG: twin-arginine translocase TatA/TatE family subunit [Acidobacteria bacterium]|nr:twin-arginine translocase TatA/TatE family subunit [Acidobacteriota bacterium]